MSEAESSDGQGHGGGGYYFVFLVKAEDKFHFNSSFATAAQTHERTLFDKGEFEGGWANNLRNFVSKATHQITE